MGSFTVVVFMLKVNVFCFKFCMSFHQVLFILDFWCVSLAVVISLFPYGNLTGSITFIFLWHIIKKFVTWLFPQYLVFFIIITFIFTMFWFCLFSSIKISSRKKRVLCSSKVLYSKLIAKFGMRALGEKGLNKWFFCLDLAPPPMLKGLKC